MQDAAFVVVQKKLEEFYGSEQFPGLIRMEQPWDGKRVLVFGKPGVGKTTHLKRLAFEWARLGLWRGKFDAVVLLKGGQTLEKVLASLLVPKATAAEFAKWCKQSIPSACCGW